jgi:beta-catenin-like protein 1
LTWSLTRLQKKERPVTQNKQYTAEILSIILHLSPPQLQTLLTHDPVDIFLTQLSPYRKRDPPRGADDEAEFLENVFDCLCSTVQTPGGKAQFVAAEGVELVLLFAKGDGKVARARGMKVLDFAVGGTAGEGVCRKLVEAGGLKVLFGIFMRASVPEMAEHLVGIFVSLFRHLPADSAERLRLLVKFAERDYEKIARLLAVREEFIGRLARVDVELAAEEADEEESAEERRQRWYLRKVSEGGFVVQLCALLLGWLVVEDKGMGEYIRERVELDEIRDTIKGNSRRLRGWWLTG